MRCERGDDRGCEWRTQRFVGIETQDPIVRGLCNGEVFLRAEPGPFVDEDTRAIRVFNRRLARDRRVDIALVPIGDGVTLARKR